MPWRQIDQGIRRAFPDDAVPVQRCQDLEMALQNGGEHDPELRRHGLKWPRVAPGGYARRRTSPWLRRYRIREADHADRRIACREAADRPGREDRTEPAGPVRKREEVQEVLRCPGVGRVSGQVRPARFAVPSLNTSRAADRGTRRSLARPLADDGGRGPRSRRGGTGPAIVTGCHVNVARSTRRGRRGGRRARSSRPAHMER